MNPCYLLGAGIHSCLGQSVDQTVLALKTGLSEPDKVSCRLAEYPTLIPYHLLQGCAYPGHDSSGVEVRLHKVLEQVITRAISEAELSTAEVKNLGIFLGSSSFEILDEEQRFREALITESTPIALAECGMGNLAERIRTRFSITGPDFTFNTACTSSANAAWYAAKLIDAGELDHALVIAVEFANDTTTYGFQALQLLSDEPMKPFDSRRKGLVLGESCAAIVLGRNQSARYRTSLVGGANLCDTYSMSITSEDGTTVSEVIKQALHSANISPEDILAIKTHGTATQSGDAAEAKGMLSVFNPNITATALKPYFGHTLGACGVTELIAFCCAIEDGFIPALPGIASDNDSAGISLNQKLQSSETGHYMLNYFGFGGNNTSLVVKVEVTGD